jgi:hypothetical protein
MALCISGLRGVCITVLQLTVFPILHAIQNHQGFDYASSGCTIIILICFEKRYRGRRKDNIEMNLKEIGRENVDSFVWL